LRGATLLVGCIGLAWGIGNVASGQTSDDFRDAEARLLRFETFSRPATIAVLDSPSTRELNSCDVHAQHALMLMEIPLADAALRSGAVQDFDQRTLSLETRARQTLACVPRDTLMWILLFGLQTQHGSLDERTFDLLAMSYETSPQEAWVAVRRIVVAIPVMRFAPAPVQDKILSEFQWLITHGFVEMTARAYAETSEATRALLQPRIDALDARSQNRFTEAVQKLRS
jgi:hypothetical protein